MLKDLHDTCLCGQAAHGALLAEEEEPHESDDPRDIARRVVDNWVSPGLMIGVSSG